MQTNISDSYFCSMVVNMHIMSSFSSFSMSLFMFLWFPLKQGFSNASLVRSWRHHWTTCCVNSAEKEPPDKGSWRWIDNGCVRLSQKLLPTQIESGHSSLYPSSLTGLLVQLNISSFLHFMSFFIVQRFSKSFNGSFKTLWAKGWDQIVSQKVLKSSGSVKPAV